MLNEIEASQLSDTEFKIMVIKKLSKLNENYQKVQGIKSRLDEAEDRITKLEDKVEKNTEKEQEKEKRLRKNEEGLREMWEK